MAVRIEPHAEPIPGYKLLDRLGAGGFGEVWKAEAPGGIFKAIKFVYGDLRSQDNDLVRSPSRSSRRSSASSRSATPIILSLDRFDIIDGQLLIVMELADRNLWDRFRECRAQGMPGIPRDELLRYMEETAEVLDLMNDQFQLQHLDIKPQNLFLLVQPRQGRRLRPGQGPARGWSATVTGGDHAGLRRPGDVRRASSAATATSTAWPSSTRSC